MKYPVMSVVFDTNVILDAALNRAGSEAANGLIQAVIAGEMNGYVTANSITDIHYVIAKALDGEKAKDFIRGLLSIFLIIGVDRTICEKALDVPMADYEDAIVAVCASRVPESYIVTQDKKFMRESGSPVQAMSPETILQILQGKLQSR